jgi:DNA repair exonuclease SbcCD ATPase subunit
MASSTTEIKAVPKSKSKLKDPLGCTLKTALKYKFDNIKNPLTGIKDLLVAMTKRPIITIAGEEVELDLSGGEGFNRISFKKHYLPNETLTEDMISYYNDFPSILENATHDRKEFLKTFLKGLNYRYNTIKVELNKNVKEQGDTRNVRRKTDQEQKLGDLIKIVTAIIKNLDSPEKKTVEAMEKVKENELQSLIRKFAMLVLRTNISPDQQKFITTLREMEEVLEDKIEPKSPLETQVAALASGDIYRDLVSGLDPQLFEGLTADTTKGKILEIIKKKSDLEGELAKQNKASVALQKIVEEAEKAKRIAEEAKQTSETKLLEAQRRLTGVGVDTSAVQAVQTALGIRDQSVEDHLIKDIALRRAKEEALAAEELAAHTQRKLNQVRAELSSVEDDAERKMRELGGARSEIAELKAEIAEKEAAALKAITVAKDSLDASEVKLKEAEAKLKEKQSILEAAESNLEKAKANKLVSNNATQTLAVTRATASVNTAVNEVAEAATQTEAVREETELQRSETVKAAAAAAAKILELRLRYATSERALRNEKEKAAANKLIIDRLNEELTNAKAELAALQQAQPINNQEEINGLKAALAEKEGEITKARADLDRIQMELNHLKESTSRNNTDKIANLTANVAEKEAIIAKNNAELLALREQVADAEENKNKIRELTVRVNTLTREKDALTTEKVVLQNKGTKFNAITKYATEILKGQTPPIPNTNDHIKQMLEKIGTKSDDICALAYFVNYFYSTLPPPKEMMKEINDNLDILFTSNVTSAKLYQLLTEIEPALLLANKIQYSSAGTYSIQQETELFKNILEGARKINSLEAWSIVRKGRGSTANNMMIYPDDDRVLLFYIPNRTPPDTQKILFKYDTSTGIISRTTTYIDDESFNKKDKGISYDVLFLYFLAAAKRYIHATCVIPKVDDNACLPIYIDIVDVRGIKLSDDLITIFTRPPYCFRTSGGSYLIKGKLYDTKQFMAAIDSVINNCKKSTKIPIPPGFNMRNEKLIITTDKFKKSLEAQLDLSSISGQPNQFYTCTKIGGGTKKRTKHAKNFTQKKRR